MGWHLASLAATDINEAARYLLAAADCRIAANAAESLAYGRNSLGCAARGRDLLARLARLLLDVERAAATIECRSIRMVASCGRDSCGALIPVSRSG